MLKPPDPKTHTCPHPYLSCRCVINVENLIANFEAHPLRHAIGIDLTERTSKWLSQTSSFNSAKPPKTYAADIEPDIVLGTAANVQPQTAVLIAHKLDISVLGGVLFEKTEEKR